MATKIIFLSYVPDGLILERNAQPTNNLQAIKVYTNRTRERKLKQTSLVDLFNATRNIESLNKDEVNPQLDGIETAALNASQRPSVVASPPKSSRYGRLIKPKIYGIGSQPSTKKRKIESKKQTLNTDTPELPQVECADNSTVHQISEHITPKEVPRKRGRQKRVQCITQTDAHIDQPKNGIPIKDEPIDLTIKVEPINTSNMQQKAIDLPKKKGRYMSNKPTETPPDIKYTCGNCNEQVQNSKWKSHVARHYGVTWRVNIDEAIDVNDDQVMKNLMSRFMKTTKLQYFKCAKCLQKKRSVVGFISHIEVCGLTQDEVVALKSECPYCKRLYRKVSLEIHIHQYCTVRRAELAAQNDAAIPLEAIIAQEVPEEVVYSASGRPKRTIKPTRVKPKRNVEEFIKVGLKITGGVFKQWATTLQIAGVLTCPNVDCGFETNEVAPMRIHHRECQWRVLQCRLCFEYFNGQTDMVRHVHTEHNRELEGELSEDGTQSDDNDNDYTEIDQTSSSDADDGTDSDEDFEEDDFDRSRIKKCKSGKRKNAVSLTRILEDDTPEFWEMIKTYFSRILNLRNGFFKMAHTWTKDYITINYDQFALALNDHLQKDFKYKYLTQSEYNKCLKILQPKSIKFMCRCQSTYSKDSALPINATMNTLDVFGCSMIPIGDEEVPILFCGGRIVTMQWIPYPSDYNGNQTLIVCTQDKNAPLTNAINHKPTTKSYSTLIQLWSISTKAEKVCGVRFTYGIEYIDGPISAMAICPSDAYIPTKRLGIVAIPDRYGNINILSLPDIKCKPNKNIVRLDAEVKLQLHFDSDNQQIQTVTQIVWSRWKGHRILCAGYNTGLIAIWNFDHLKSTYLCRTTTDNIKHLIPYKQFQGALTCITHLDVHADNASNMRWILVGSLERRERMYDLNDGQLIPYVSPVFKSRIISGIWPMHWPVYLSMVDAAWTRLGGGLHIKQILYTNNQPQSSTLYLDCHPSNLSFNDWLNTVIFGNDAGDVFMVNFQQMLAHDRSGDSSEMKILSSTDILADADAKSSHIIFNVFENAPIASRNQTRILASNQSLLSKINRIECNPNETYHHIYAVGYDNGFCRISYIKTKCSS